MRTVRFIAVTILLLLFVHSITPAEEQSTSGENDRIIRFDKNFKMLNQDVKLPFGKKILLTGPLATEINKLSIIIFTDTSEQEVEVKTNNQSWSSVVGPFGAGEMVFVIFNYGRPIDEKEKIQLLSDVKETLIKARKNIFETTTGKQSIKEFSENAVNEILKELPDYCATLKMEDKTSFTELFKKRLEKVNMLNLFNAIRGYNENIRDIRNIAEEIIPSSGNNKIKDEMKKIISDPALYDYSKILPDVNGDTTIAKGNKDALPKLFQRLSSNKNIADSLLKVVSDDVKKIIMEETVVSMLTENASMKVSELEYYAGFDIGQAVIPSFKELATLFTVNIYFKKVEYSQDPQKFFDNISITAGTAIAKSFDTESTLYFIGGGYRLNKIFRAFMGVSIFKNKNESGDIMFNYPFTIGLSLNFRYISDLLQIFSGASSNLK